MTYHCIEFALYVVPGMVLEYKYQGSCCERLSNQDTGLPCLLTIILYTTMNKNVYYYEDWKNIVDIVVEPMYVDVVV
jgi:hypothetical protein